MVYLITYDLKSDDTEARNKRVHKAIKNVSPVNIYLNPLESTYFIKSSETAEVIFNKIKPVFNETDRFIVCEVSVNNIFVYLYDEDLEYLKKMFL
jgi:hypothetical protein